MTWRTSDRERKEMIARWRANDERVASDDGLYIGEPFRVYKYPHKWVVSVRIDECMINGYSLETIRARIIAHLSRRYGAIDASFYRSASDPDTIYAIFEGEV